MTEEIEKLIKISTLRDVEIKLKEAQLEGLVIPEIVFEVIKEVEKELALEKERLDDLRFGNRVTEDEGDVVVEVPNGEDDFDTEVVGK